MACAAAAGGFALDADVRRARKVALPEPRPACRGAAASVTDGCGKGATANAAASEASEAARKVSASPEPLHATWYVSLGIGAGAAADGRWARVRGDWPCSESPCGGMMLGSGSLCTTLAPGSAGNSASVFLLMGGHCNFYEAE